MPYLKTLSFCRYNDGPVNFLLRMATALDPRFKLFSCPSDDDKKIVQSIQEMLIKFIEEKEEECAGTVEEPSNKRRKLSGRISILI